MNPYEIIKMSVDNMNSLPSAKYQQTPVLNSEKVKI